MIETSKQLESLMQQAHTAGAVALDTEFVWERTYFPQLGLIQLALSENECFLIDPLALNDLSPLGQLLADKNVVKIFHDGSQDLAILQRETGADPKNIFDTRMGAGFAGLPSTLSLLALAKELLDVTLTKTQTRTNWIKRPLNQKQVQYGLNDVRYLRKIRRIIIDRAQPETLAWMEEELSRFDQPESYTGIDDAERYVKIRGTSRLSRASLAILRELARWREEEARRRDKPRGHILRDEVLVFIAQEQLAEVSPLRDVKGISDKVISRYGAALLDNVSNALSKPEHFPPLLRNTRLTKTEEKRLHTLQAWIRQQAETRGLDPALLGNKAELKGLIRGDLTTGRQHQGWRQQFLAGFDLG